ncbi:helix-turn-helix domain-containing protein [Streptomyces albus]
MPSLGAISTTWAPEATTEVQKFACALKLLIPHIEPGATMKAKAEKLSISPALLSHWLHGRRLPSPEMLKTLYDRAAEGARRVREAAMICSFAEIEGLLRSARRSTCRRCRGGCTCGEPQGYRRNGNAPPAVAHTPDGEGYRRNSSPAAVGPPEDSRRQEELIERLLKLPLADRANLLWGMGAALKEKETAAAVHALAGADMKGEVEIILRSAEAAGKDYVEIVMALGECR